jgi:hypothetical protein
LEREIFYATNELSVNSKITGFEINETTAKIAKILHPEADINLRSFETEFIDERKEKKRFSEKYDLVIGIRLMANIVDFTKVGRRT